MTVVRRRRPFVFRLIVIAGLFALSLFISAAAGASFDETWFLQVVNRVVRGETLYRDVFYLATPFPIQLTALVAHAFGTAILVEKTITSAAFVAELCLADALARRVRLTPASRGLVWLALFVYTQHFPNPPYRAIGSAFMLGAFLALFAWLDRRRTSEGRAGRGATRALLACGALAGASFSAMPNHGLLALGAACLVILLEHVHAGSPIRVLARAWAVLAVAFAAPVLVSLAPVVASGSLTPFLDFTIRNKGPYVRAGGFPFFAELGALVLVNPFEDPSAVARLYRGFVVLLVPAAFIGALAALFRAPRDTRVHAAAVLLLVICGVAGAYPRMNRFHLSYASPAVIVGLVFSSSVFLKFACVPPSIARVVLAAWLIPGCVLTLLGAVRDARSADLVWSSVPHFHGVRVRRAEEARILAIADRIRHTLGPEPVMFGGLTTTLYLAADLQNPTPFDEFSVMGFGTHGQQDVIRGLADGRLRPVCLAPGEEPLSPFMLVSYIRGTLTAGEDLGACVVYR